MTRKSFPSNFVWGVATSAYQIEGATTEGGRGESVWDRFAKVPGAVSDGTDGSVACDHFHGFRGDIAVMQEIGVHAYRFSIAWPRILPTGRGRANEAGLDFYDKLVDALLEAKIRPFVTLNHWDLPQALDDAGGWGDRATVSAFVEYADAVSRRLGDRVRDWTTHNEPWCIAHLGHHTGEHAPGRKNPHEALRAAHHLLLSHGLAVPVLRANSKSADVGIVLNLVPSYPASPSAADVEAAHRFDGWFNRWYLDPLYRGTYPEDVIAARVAAGDLEGPELSFVHEGDLAAIATPTDYLGINYYSRAIIRSESVAEADNLPRTIAVPTREQQTDMGWEIYPDGLRAILTRVHRDYQPKRLYVTENGAAFSTSPDASGRIADVDRVDYVRHHLAGVSDAITEGAPVAGYFLWSLLDNFEWQFGYSKRFGVVWVDYPTQQRLLKDSALYYRDAIAKSSVEVGADPVHARAS
jgi:beta-glucosidase